MIKTTLKKTASVTVSQKNDAMKSNFFLSLLHVQFNAGYLNLSVSVKLLKLCIFITGKKEEKNEDISTLLKITLSI